MKKPEYRINPVRKLGRSFLSNRANNRRLKMIFFAMLFLVLLPAIVSAQEEKGKKLYDDWCAQCHGYKGDGKAYATDFTFPKPRDFVWGIYKFRSTPSGAPPTDNDIIRSIKEGNPGTSMPPWKRFSDDELKALVDYLKKFAPETFEFPEEPIKIGKAPAVTDELIEKGKKLFEEAKCWECHGRLGRGDGEKGAQEKVKDEWGDRIYPANLTHQWELRNGSDVEDLFRTVSVGIEGTPMTSYLDSFKDDQRWALAHFIKSLQIKRKLGIALMVNKVENIPSSTDDALWDKSDYIDLPLAGQLMFETRHFSPTLMNVRVRGLFTDSEVAIMLEWTDKKPNKGDDGLPPDAVRLQFPLKIPSATKKPYFYLGDRKNPVNLWYWKAPDGHALELNAYGPRKESIIQKKQMDLKVVSDYKDGLYRVIFRRQLDTKDEKDIIFRSGKFIPFSVSVYDGLNKEEKNKTAISGWYYIMLKPPTPLRVYILPPLASFTVLGIGIILRRRLKNV